MNVVKSGGGFTFMRPNETPALMNYESAEEASKAGESYWSVMDQWWATNILGMKRDDPRVLALPEKTKGFQFPTKSWPNL